MDMFALSGVWMRLSDGKLPSGKGVKMVCQADIVCTFEFVLHFDLCNSTTVTVSPNQ